MKRNMRILALAVGLSISAAASASTTTVIESWENTLDGWTVPPSYNAEAFTPSFITTPAPGVTDGSYALAITGTGTNGPNYGQLIAGPSTMALTTLLGSSTQLSLDVYTPAGSFGGFLQFDFEINNTDTGFTSLDGYSYPGTTIGSEHTITVPIPSSVSSVLATSANPTAILISVGGGYTAGNETMYLDNLRASNVPPPVTFSSTSASWVASGGGPWETATNWSSNTSIPGAAGSQEMFGAIGGSANPVVTLGQAAVGTIVDFQSANGSASSGYTINNSNAGSLNITSTLEVDSGTHAINVPVTFGNVNIQVQPGASISIPSVSNSGQYGTFYLTANDGVSDGGMFSEGGMTYCSLDVSGTWNFLASMSGEFFSVTDEAGSLINVGKYAVNANGLFGGPTAGGTVNIDSGGVLTLGYYSGSSFNGSFTGTGQIVFTGLISGPQSNSLYTDSPTFNGPITINGGSTLSIQSNHGMGSGSATNTVTLDNGILQAIGSFSASQNIIVTANGGTIDTDGHPGGDPSQPVIPGGCAITVGAISSTASGTLTKINAGQVTATKITGVSLVINGGTVQLARNGTTAGASSLNALTLATSGGVPQGSLDITNNIVTIAAPSGSDPISTIVSYLLTGYDNGNWDGAGIQSSAVLTQRGTGIGYADGNTDSGTAAAAGTIVVRDTWLGDLDLDGSVTPTDLATLLANLGHSGSGVDWAHGDLNYDGVVNNDDVSLFMLGAAEFRAGGSIAVPEPASLALLALGAGLLSQPRRRRQ